MNKKLSQQEIRNLYYAYKYKKLNNDINELITKYNNSIKNVQKKYNEKKTPTLGVKLQKFKKARNTLKNKRRQFTELDVKHMKSNRSLAKMADYINTWTT